MNHLKELFFILHQFNTRQIYRNNNSSFVITQIGNTNFFMTQVDNVIIKFQ